ncbi:GNAT family N-acetyltransferase [Mycetocola zhadangensis]|uniref:N-acetyltransferase n=1 Tax=Mycetocola zhadangensis TaxID=1164595 RepID=A0A3L7J4G0_9MICO|nr:GNAT family protein [Mycetocola zhadangensis]RLQ85566.1 N-acetyltransferase [Mycetocola zhadangensis]GGE83767.1 N-acetyltransferase GCN5 [Mycetocola zhadangensis]
MPVLTDGHITVRQVRLRDARAMERELLANRNWLRPWEATSPYAPRSFDMRASIRSLLSNARSGGGLPLVMEYDGELAGQLNVSGITYGSLSSATLGYWVSERFAGKGVTPTSVALATDHCFSQLGLHRMEICIRPENGPSLRVVEKLGFRYEGLRRRYIHINGDWRDHFCFALVREEVPDGVLRRWKNGRVPAGVASIPDADRRASELPLVPPPALF